MKIRHSQLFITLLVAISLLPIGAQSAPRSTPVTVVNDASTPVPVTVLNAPSGTRTFEFVGFSSGTFNGGRGVITHTTACQQNFPGSRMCTSVEFLNTVNYPSSLPIGTRAWIRPVYQPFTSTGTSQNNYSMDASGVGPTQNSLSCFDGGNHGLTVAATGNFTTTGCSADHPVACCAPQ
jgi:hypothetical protein